MRKTGPHARAAEQKFYEANIGLVYMIAQRFRCKLSFDDRVQEGCVALMAAVRGFDPDRGKFSSYAVPIIERAILRASREDTTVRVPNTSMSE